MRILNSDGSSVIAWDGLDSSGRSVSAGTYMLRQEGAGGVGIIGKITVLK